MTLARTGRGAPPCHTHSGLECQTNVWYNKGLSSLHAIFALIKEADLAHQFRLICTHTRSEFVGFLTSDAAEVEPVVRDDRDYLDYCLEFCRREKVRLFVPGRRSRFLAGHQAAFTQIGVKMIVAADAPTLALLEDKAALYRRLLGESVVPIPDHVLVHSLAEYDSAVAALSAKREMICVKPNTGIYGQGFRILTEKGREIDRILNGETVKIGYSHFRGLLAEAQSFRGLMVMQYLEGLERSVDCLAGNGRLLRCVVRLKPKDGYGPQLLEENPAICTIASDLTSILRLEGLFNIQLKDGGGVPHLLEINPRMSGGLPFACHSGLNLPYWALKLALADCTPDDIPYPRTGVRVAQVTTGVVAERAPVNA